MNMKRVTKKVILFSYILEPPSVGCSPPETFRFAPSLPLRYACGPLPLTCPRVGTGPGGDSRTHLRRM